MPVPDINHFYIEIGLLIKGERQKKGINQELLGSRLNLSRASIINLEKGRHRPSIYQLLIIAEVLNIDYLSLLPSSTFQTKKDKKATFTNFDNAVTDQDLTKKSTKVPLQKFLTDIKKS